MKLRMQLWQPISLNLAAALLALGCGDHKNNDNHGCDNCGGMGPNGTSTLSIQADLSGAVGLLALETSSTALRFGLADDTDDGSGSLKKVDDTGDIGNVLKTGTDTDSDGKVDADSEEKKESTGWKQTIPGVKTMALGPDGNIYLHFQQPIWFNSPDGASNYQCNLFVVDGGSYSELKASGADPQALVCLDKDHYVQDWNQSRESVFQFDTEGNIYYPGWSQTDGKSELVKRDSAGATSIKVNKNIWLQDFFVTKTGGLFYVGTNSNGGGGGNSGGFFRYVSPAGALQQISDGWWNFKFEPVEGANGDKALFYGPDPLATSTTNQWQTACLFQYDASKYDIDSESPLAAAVTSVINCGNGDSWSYFSMSSTNDITTYGSGYNQTTGKPASTAWLTEASRRCTSTGDSFAGGGEIQKLHQTSAGDIYIVGTLNVKSSAGTSSCNLRLRGDYCRDANNNLVWATNQTACQAVSGQTWTDGDPNQNGYNWYNTSDSRFCTIGNDATGVDTTSWYAPTGNGDQVIKVENVSCVNQSGANDMWAMMTQYTGIAKVDKTNKKLVALTTPANGEASKFWFIDDTAFFVTKKNSIYTLKKLVEGGSPVTLKSNFEIYQLATSPTPGKILFNGLDFATNEVVFGDLDITSGNLDKNEAVGESKVSAILNFDEAEASLKLQH